MTKILNLLFVLLIPVALFGQNDDKNDKAAFRDFLKSKEAERKKSVVDYAHKNRIPITGTGTDGEFMYLHHIANDRPVYYTTRGDNADTADAHEAYIKMGENNWQLLDNNLRLDKQDNEYLYIKSDEVIAGAYILNSRGKHYYKIEKPGTQELRISTYNMAQDEYIVCIKTALGLSAFNIIVN